MYMLWGYMPSDLSCTRPTYPSSRAWDVPTLHAPRGLGAGYVPPSLNKGSTYKQGGRWGFPLRGNGKGGMKQGSTAFVHVPNGCTPTRLTPMPPKGA